jgi:nitrogenase molybdenum-cofactor synthesis protein NifE
LFGSLRYFANIKNSIHLIHGPNGCSFFSRDSVISQNNIHFKEYFPKIFSTDFNENDVVFGGILKLENALKELIEAYSPEVLFVYNCCVTEIIGENIDSICKQTSIKYAIKCIPIHSAGFKGDQRIGMNLAADILFDNFIVDNTNMSYDNSINILGNMHVDNKSIKELQYYLTESGITINCIFPSNSSLLDIENITKAKLNYVLCNTSSYKLADKLKKVYQMPYISDGQYFMGPKNCLNMLDQIFDFFGKKSKSHYTAYEKLEKQMVEVRNYFNGKKAVIVSGATKSLGFAEVFNFLGIDVEFIFTEVFEKKVYNDKFFQYAKLVQIDEPAEGLNDRIRSINPDYVFTTLIGIVLPEIYIELNKLYYSGFSGVIELSKELKKHDEDPVYKYLKRKKR